MSLDRVRERVRRGARKRIGFSISERDEAVLYAAQGGRCAICDESKPLHGRQGLVVDHDHFSRAVRGLICPPCNRALGLMKDDPARLAKAIDYLNQHKNPPRSSPYR